MAQTRDMTTYVQNDLADQLSGKSGSADGLRHEIEQAEHSFDFDSYALYYSEHNVFCVSPVGWLQWFGAGSCRRLDVRLL